MQAPEPPPRSRPRVALLVETSSVYGRRVLQGLTRHLRSHRPWSIIVEQRDLGSLLPDWIRSWDGDGVISRGTTPELIEILANAEIPLVDLTNRHGIRGRSPQMWADNDQIARLAMEHFLERGFARFAACGFTGEPWSSERSEAFARHLEAADHTCERHDSPWLGLSAETAGAWDDDQRRLAAWLAGLPRPLAVFATNDVRGQHVLEACTRAGLGVPEDVAVLGVDDDDVLCELCDPPLSSVIPDAEALGQAAGRALDAMMAGEAVAAEVRLIPPVGVATRQSTDVLAIEDPNVARAMRFIREHACDGITVDAVLSRIPMSRSVIERRFRAHFGRSPGAVIRQVQLKEVRRLLRETEHKLSRIAELTGFKHPEHLSVVFKRELGLTPGEFRANR